jgi:hypothetical protein
MTRPHEGATNNPRDITSQDLVRRINIALEGIGSGSINVGVIHYEVSRSTHTAALTRRAADRAEILDVGPDVISYISATPGEPLLVFGASDQINARRVALELVARFEQDLRKRNRRIPS